MKNSLSVSLSLVIVAILTASSAGAQAQSAAGSPVASSRTDLYHVHFVKAALGKTTDLLNSIKAPTPDSPMPTHALILRHLEGDEWDFAVIEHLGTRSTLEASGNPRDAERELRAWHSDTYAQGPPWAEFARAMGIGQAQAGAAPAGKDIYLVGVYRGAAGHRAQLEEALKRITGAFLRPRDAVLLQHREGSPWDYLWVTRYNDWKDLAAQQEDPGNQERFRRAGFTEDPGIELRNHIASHHDTIAERVAVQAPAKSSQ